MVNLHFYLCTVKVLPPYDNLGLENPEIVASLVKFIPGVFVWESIVNVFCTICFVWVENFHICLYSIQPLTKLKFQTCLEVRVVFEFHFFHVSLERNFCFVLPYFELFASEVVSMGSQPHHIVHHDIFVCPSLYLTFGFKNIFDVVKLFLRTLVK